MRKHVMKSLLAGAVAFVALTGAAQAQVQAFTASRINVFAGPSPEYPVVAQVVSHQPITVMGCLQGYSWCDVAFPGVRGWAYAGGLRYPYQGGYRPLLGYGAGLGLPLLTFSIGPYWDRYYRGRPWFNDRGRWGRPPGPGWHGGPPPRPGWHGGPPHGRPGGPPHGGPGRPGGPPHGRPGGPGGHGGPPHGRPGGPGAHGGPPRGGPSHAGPGRPGGPGRGGAAHGPSGGGHGGPPPGGGGGRGGGGGDPRGGNGQ